MQRILAFRFHSLELLFSDFATAASLARPLRQKRVPSEASPFERPPPRRAKIVPGKPGADTADTLAFITDKEGKPDPKDRIEGYVDIVGYCKWLNEQSYFKEKAVCK